MKEMTEEEKLNIWRKAVQVPGYPSDQIRKDACGAWIVFNQYGKQDSPFGWEVDHIVPRILLEQKNVSYDEMDNEANLRPLHWRNNRTKNDDYPTYIASVISDGDRNKISESFFSVNKGLQKKLKELFNL